MMSVNIRCYYKSGRNGQKKQKKGEREENTQRERGAEREKRNDTRKINTENTDLFEEFESLFFIQDWECVVLFYRWVLFMRALRLGWRQSVDC